MASRSLIFLTQLLLGALFLEVFLYHPAVALERDAWARVPLLTAPAGMAAASWLLLSRTRLAQAVFRLSCLVMLLVGMAGTAIHLAIHAPDLAALLGRGAWLGNPPTLAPLAFAVAALLGLIALPAHQDLDARHAWEALGGIGSARALHVVALAASLAAWFAAFAVPFLAAAAASAVAALVASFAALALEWAAASVRAAPRR